MNRYFVISFVSVLILFILPPTGTFSLDNQFLFLFFSRLPMGILAKKIRKPNFQVPAALNGQV
jgi:hypothetical protein